jgi:uncharacterized caspase-like protein
MRYLMITLLCFFAQLGFASAQSRHALVIGIDTYTSVPTLEKARNDAVSVHEALSKAGFNSDLVVDADQLQLLRALSDFSSRVRPGDEVIFYFAGHGVEIEGRNYLLPSDIPEALPGGEFLVTSRALALDNVLDILRSRGARVSMLIIDACRDNPFPRQGTRSLGATRGLGRVEAAPEGTFILFSAGNGQTALDRLSDTDPNPNSVFTRILLPRLTEPGLPVHEMSRLVRTEVRQLARTIGHDQFPAVYDQFDGSFELVALRPEPSPPVVVEVPSVPAQDPCLAIMPIWSILEGSDDKEALRTFSDTYQDSCGVLAVLARNRANMLASQVSTEVSQVDSLDQPEVEPGDNVQQETEQSIETELESGISEEKTHSPETEVVLPAPSEEPPLDSVDIAALPSREIAAPIEPQVVPIDRANQASATKTIGLKDVALSQDELNHIRVALAQIARKNDRVVFRSIRNSQIFDDFERAEIAKFNAREVYRDREANPEEMAALSRDTADALLNRPLDPVVPWIPGRRDIVKARDWSSYNYCSTPSCSYENFCEVSSVARNVSTRFIAVLPEIRLSIARRFGDRDVEKGIQWELAIPHQFRSSTDLRASVDGQEATVFRSGHGVFGPSLIPADSEALIRQMIRGSRLELRGTNALNGEAKRIEYSLMGFTASLRRAAELCNRPEILP